ncbi:MAG: hypothetical protein SGCHY_002816 [Lobulomycetales sp.]
MDQETGLPIFYADSVSPFTPFPHHLPDAAALQLDGKLRECRDLLFNRALQLLCGDTLAAEYFIAFLFAKREPASATMPLDGMRHVNFTLQKMEDRKESMFSDISDLLASVSPFAFPLALTIESLNAATYVSSVADSGVLDPGLLQLPNETILSIDETNLQTGTLKEKGVENITELKRIVDQGQQMIKIMFGQVFVAAPFGMMVLSEGKSLLNIETIVPVVPDRDSDPEAHAITSESDLDLLRQYMCTRVCQEYSIPKDLEEEITSSYVARASTAEGDADGPRRLLFDKQAGPEDLARGLELARALSLSYGCAELSFEVLEKACAMERDRRARCAAMKSDVAK